MINHDKLLTFQGGSMDALVQLASLDALVNVATMVALRVTPLESARRRPRLLQRRLKRSDDARLGRDSADITGPRVAGNIAEHHPRSVLVDAGPFQIG